MSEQRDRPVVYRTGIGRLRVCASCGRAEDECRCSGPRAPSGTLPGMPRDGFVRLARAHRGRGKTVTVVAGLPDDAALVAGIAQTLKRLCGSGGSVKDGVIELQGDHRDRLEPKLRELGYKVKRAGG